MFTCDLCGKLVEECTRFSVQRATEDEDNRKCSRGILVRQVDACRECHVAPIVKLADAAGLPAIPARTNNEHRKKEPVTVIPDYERLIKYLFDNPEAACSMGIVDSFHKGRYVRVSITRRDLQGLSQQEGRGQRLEDALKDLYRTLSPEASKSGGECIDNPDVAEWIKKS
jgi:hypothetical protein